MQVFQDVKCVRKGTKGIHTETFVTLEAYRSMQTSNTMDLCFLDSCLQNFQNSLIREKSNVSRNLSEKYFEICSLLLEYVNLYSDEKKYEEKLLEAIDRIVKYLREDFENNNAPTLKDIVRFIYSLMYVLSRFFKWNNKFSNRFEMINSLSHDYNVLTQDECNRLKFNIDRYCVACNFQQISFSNPVTEYAM